METSELTSVGPMWREVASSTDVPDSGVLTVDVDGEEVVVWRSATGVLSACESRCPHQWAHLGVVGTVDGEELVCLAHFWRFGTDGAASKTSMNGRRDDKGEIRVYEIREVGGRIELPMTAG